MNEENAKHWSVKNVKSIMDKAKKSCSSSKTAWSYWTAYLLEANCKIYPGTENHFSYLASQRLNQKQQKDFKITSLQNIEKSIKNSQLSLIISAEQDQKRHRLNLEDHYNQTKKYFYYPKNK